MLRKILIVGISLSFILICVVAFTNATILSYSKYTVPFSSVPPSDLGLVFGGGMQDNGDQSQMQKDRVRVGVELFKAGKVHMLMMTGDDGGFRGDEVDAMRTMAIDMGVPTSSVVIDPHGYRTYESCYREKNVYGITRAVAISQNFHLPRIAYLCNNLGVQVLGVSADISNYGLDLPKMQLRDVLAKVLAWWQIEVSHPLPRSLEK